MFEELEGPVDGFGERHVGCESVDADLHVRGVGCDFGTFFVAGGSGDTAEFVAIDGHILNVEGSASDAVVRFVLLPYPHGEQVANETVGIETADGVPAAERDEVDEVDESGESVKSESADNAPAERFTCHTIAPRVFSEGPIEPTSGCDGRSLINLKQLVCGADALGFGENFVPEFIGSGRIGYGGTDESHLHIWADTDDVGVYDNVGFHKISIKICAKLGFYGVNVKKNGLFRGKWLLVSEKMLNFVHLQEQNQEQHKKFKTMTIGIIAAMDKELELLKPMLKDLREEEKDGYRLFFGTAGEHTIVAMKCGIGKVNAALGTMTMLREAHPDMVINSGVAGSADSSVVQNDVVVGEQVAYHDVWCGPENPWGAVQGLPLFYEGAWDALVALPERSEIKRGLICTGDQFVENAAQVKSIKDRFPSALAVDMESAAIAQVCHLREVPMLSLRVISDCPWSEKDKSEEYIEFWQSAPKHTFEIVRELISRL